MIGQRLRALRLSAKLQQTELAELLGLTQGAVSKIENGAGTTTQLLERWVAACRGTLRLDAAGGVSPADELAVDLAGLGEDDAAAVIEAARLLAQLGSAELMMQRDLLRLRAQHNAAQRARTA